ncbi:MAG TPA: GDSL-type esterase/lipase family protein [Candidatus Paceibacterota bacterium]
MDEVLCVFGDSTGWGAWDKERGGWVNRLWLFCAQNIPGLWVHNLSITGETTKTLLPRLERESEVREAGILIIQIGKNDAAYIKEPDNLQISPEKFRANILALAALARKIAGTVIFIGLANVDESKTKPVPWAKDLYYTNENIEKYNTILKEVCGELTLPFIDILGYLAEDDLEDGLHPNARGHEKIFVKVRDFLLNEKIII